MYTDEKNSQIVLALLKKRNIRWIVASPGTTNAPFVRSAQQDGFFEIRSSVDERSAAYMACGLSEATGEPVVISCTGATASRNYMSALTEAYYRKLPIIAVTSMNDAADIGNLTSQVIDRSSGPNDIDFASARIDPIESEKQFQEACLTVNRILGEVGHNGGGPVRIELITSERGAFSTSELPDVHLIERFSIADRNAWPKIATGTKVLIAMGSLPPSVSFDFKALESFCTTNNAVVLANMASGKRCSNSLYSALACAQLLDNPAGAELAPDLLIQVGEISGDYDTQSYLKSLDVPVWRVSPDGEMRKTFRRLDAVFQCSLEEFFDHYAGCSEGTSAYFKAWAAYDGSLRFSCPELPFSNIWIASRLSPSVPAGSTLHGSILSSMAALNFFPPSVGVRTAANVGGFGIDGCLSSLVGASLADPGSLHICLVGDLSFFYDMNVLGNRHVGSNLRILLVNNNLGMTFKHANHYAHTFGSEADEYIAAAGHFVNRFDSDFSNSPARAWAKSLGYAYFSARNKADFEKALPSFLEVGAARPILFECFVTEEDEFLSRTLVTSIDTRRTLKGAAKDLAKKTLSPAALNSVKKLISR